MSTGTALVAIESAAPALYGREQLDLIKNTFAKGASDDEFKLFIEIANRKGLDIFSRQIHLVKRKDRKTGRDVAEIQTGIDGYRVMADRSGKYEGQVGPFWCGDDGVWKDVWLNRQAPVAAKVGVLRAGCKEPFFGIALFAEYAQVYDGKPTGMWAKMPANQLAKCAEALALRKGFPAELSGIYTQEEMGQAENVITIEAQPVTTPQAVEAVALATPEQIAELKRLAKLAGYNTAGELTAWMQSNLHDELLPVNGYRLQEWLEKLPAVDVQAAIEFLENEIAERDAIRQEGETATEA